MSEGVCWASGRCVGRCRGGVCACGVEIDSFFKSGRVCGCVSSCRVCGWVGRVRVCVCLCASVCARCCERASFLPHQGSATAATNTRTRASPPSISHRRPDPTLLPRPRYAAGSAARAASARGFLRPLLRRNNTVLLLCYFLRPLGRLAANRAGRRRLPSPSPSAFVCVRVLPCGSGVRVCASVCVRDWCPGRVVVIFFGSGSLLTDTRTRGPTHLATKLPL